MTAEMIFDAAQTRTPEAAAAPVPRLFFAVTGSKLQAGALKRSLLPPGLCSALRPTNRGIILVSRMVVVEGMPNGGGS